MWNKMNRINTCLALAAVLVAFGFSEARNLTHEDLRDGIRGLEHNIRMTEDKLERHEFREKQAAENIKKMLTSIEKRLKSIEMVRGTVNRLDERMAQLETVLLQNEVKTRQEKEDNARILQEIKTAIDNLAARGINTASVNSNVDSTKIENELKDVKGALKDIKSRMHESDENIRQINEKTDQLYSGIKDSKDNIINVLDKYDTKLYEYNKAIPTEIVTLKPSYQSSSEMEQQLELLHEIAANTVSLVGEVRKVSEHPTIDTVMNTTLELVQEIKYDLKRNTNLTTNNLMSRIDRIENGITKNHEELTKSLSDLTSMTETVHSGVTKSYEELHEDLQNLDKIEKILVQSADNVLDTKRRIEYGTHQILLEVGDLVKLQGQEMNSTLNQRFDEISSSILDNQTGALANVSSKIETEMSQVWRQIGIMYQSMTASNTVLDRLQTQTESYINGTINTMDSMEGKVGQITSRMLEVDDNLNYLLGRLSLVTHEFNDIKTGLGAALDSIKGSFMIVKDKIEDAQGPGPHYIKAEP